MPIAIQEGYAPFRGYQTWYRVTGDLRAKKPPVVILHGGPGAAHDYTDAFKLLANGGRAVIHYDQLGCGRSTHLPDKGADFWTPRLFLDELENLVEAISASPPATTWSASPGAACSAPSTAITRPKGLRSLVIANSPASMELWVREANRLRAALPPEVQATLLRHEKAGTTSSTEYKAAVQVFYDRHVCRVKPMPEEMTRSFAQIAADPTVYHTMNGPSEFHVIGTLKDWNIIDQLHAHRRADAADLRPPRRGDAGGGAALRRRHQGCALGDLREFQPYAACRGDRALHAGGRRLPRRARQGARRSAQPSKSSREKQETK